MTITQKQYDALPDSEKLKVITKLNPIPNWDGTYEIKPGLIITNEPIAPHTPSPTSKP